MTQGYTKFCEYCHKNAATIRGKPLNRSLHYCSTYCRARSSKMRVIAWLTIEIILAPLLILTSASMIEFSILALFLSISTYFVIINYFEIRDVEKATLDLNLVS